MGYKHNIEYQPGTPEYQREYYLLRTNKTNEDIREYKKTGDYTKENLKNTKINQESKEYDEMGIVKETDGYVFYRNKVWSKTRYRYLKTVKFYQKHNSYCCPTHEDGKLKLVILNHL